MPIDLVCLWTTTVWCRATAQFVTCDQISLLYQFQVVSSTHSMVLVAHVLLKGIVLKLDVYAEPITCQGIINPCYQWKTNFEFHSPLVATLSHILPELLSRDKQLIDVMGEQPEDMEDGRQSRQPWVKITISDVGTSHTNDIDWAPGNPGCQSGTVSEVELELLSSLKFRFDFRIHLQFPM